MEFSRSDQLKEINSIIGGLSSLQLNCDDSVVIFGENHPQAVWFQLASYCLGVTPFHLYPEMPSSELSSLLDEVRAKVILVTNREYYDIIAQFYQPGWKIIYLSTKKRDRIPNHDHCQTYQGFIARGAKLFDEKKEPTISAG